MTQSWKNPPAQREDCSPSEENSLLKLILALAKHVICLPNESANTKAQNMQFCHCPTTKLNYIKSKTISN